MSSDQTVYLEYHQPVFQHLASLGGRRLKRALIDIPSALRRKSNFWDVNLILVGARRTLDRALANHPWLLTWAASELPSTKLGRVAALLLSVVLFASLRNRHTLGPEALTWALASRPAATPPIAAPCSCERLAFRNLARSNLAV
jgi:hypothetical protein